MQMRITGIKLPHIYSWDEAQYPEYFKKYEEELMDITVKMGAIGLGMLTDKQLKGAELIFATDQIVASIVLSGVNITVDKAHEVIGNVFERVANTHHNQLIEPTGNAYNQKCEVHMPGQNLSTYNDVVLLENCCSDELQNSLDEGFRIIAACPQPNARRPDYILGRWDPQRDYSKLGTGASRSNYVPQHVEQ